MNGKISIILKSIVRPYRTRLDDSYHLYVDGQLVRTYEDRDYDQALLDADMFVFVFQMRCETVELEIDEEKKVPR